MWWLKSTILRERAANVRCYSKRYKHAVACQLDYYMSHQFAGVACALVDGDFAAKGLDLAFLPTCPVGLEQSNVRKHQDANPSTTTIGSVEQNIFIPTLLADSSLKTSAVAAMFRKSPLCIASLGELDGDTVIGAHEDTVWLLQRMFPDTRVIASPRATKNSDLLSGKIGGIQAYTTTEVPTLKHLIGEEPVVTPLEGLHGTNLGYSQVLFAADECLEGDRREVVSAFLEATFEGWAKSIKDPKQAIEAVKEAKKMLQLDDENNDHWHASSEYDEEMLELCNNHVKETFEGDRYGVINPDRWNEASRWLTGGKVAPGTGLDSSLWQPPTNLLPGNELARKILQDANASASLFNDTYGRKPSVAIITIGDEANARYTDAERRVQLYSNPSNSWFTKTMTGTANGFEVQEIVMDGSATTDDLLSQIYNLKNVDGIQLMWPLPPHIDSTKVYGAIDVSKDVDGIHFVGQLELGNGDAFPPVTPAAAMALMEENNVEVAGKRVLVIGRSPIVGSPLASMVRQKGAAVTVAHSGIDKELLKELVGEADVILSCAGSPGLVQAEWIKGAELINVGTTFVGDVDGLVSDVEGDAGKFAKRYSPVPGGIGPLSMPVLLKNVAKAAWNHMDNRGIVEKTWERSPAALRKTFHFEDYTSAIKFGEEVDAMSTIMDHHANMTFSHRCVDGVDLTLEFFTFELGDLSEKDFAAAKAVDTMFAGNQIRMSDFTYNLSEDAIAQYPADPRGSSKVLRVDGNGIVSYFDNFSESFPSIAKDAHLVFNDSRVLDARLYVNAPDGSRVELMLLDLGDIDVDGPCQGTILHAMIRSDGVAEGDMIEEASSGIKIKISEVQGVWQEDEKSDGNGTECLVEVQSSLSVDSFLEKAGSVPIPPYFQREAEDSDKTAYNNVYADKGGSVAAPTAGLHFTDATLAEIGPENISYLSLHVGAGTFKPVLTEDAREHAMHAESFSVRVSELKRIIAALSEGKPLFVVGTTSSRTLESLFWCGLKRIRGYDVDVKSLNLDQFEWVPLSVGDGKTTTAVVALQSLIEGLDDDDVVCGRTALMITPQSYEFKVVDHLVTNFHAPDSTLMLLVSAFCQSGKKIKTVYEDAQKRGYRFLSYGDVCVFSRPGRR